MNERLNGSGPGLIGNWLLNDGGTTALDLAGSRDGTIVNPIWEDTGSEEVAGEVSASRSSFADYTIPSGAGRTYRVRAFDEYLPGIFAESAHGSYASVRDTTGRRTLLAPTNLVASDSTFENKVVLRWTDNSRAETGYQVRRDGVIITNPALDPNTTTYTDTSPTRGVVHNYSVHAVDDAGFSGPSADAGSAVLHAPASVNASDTYDAGTGITVTWVDRSAHETGYEIFRDQTANGSIDAATALATAGAGGTSYIDNTAVLGTTYEYCVRATDGTTVSGVICDTGRLVTPGTNLSGLTGLTASDGAFDDRIQLRWTDEASETGYNVYRRNDADSLQLLEKLGANVTSFNDFSAGAGNAYEYCVYAFDNANVETVGTCTTGWRAANGSISGRVATLEGGGTQGVEVQLTPSPNKALLLDGTGGFVQIPNAHTGAFNFDAADDFTVEVWLNYTGTAGTGTNEADIIEFWKPPSARYPFVLRTRGRNNAGQLGFGRYDGTNNPNVPTTRTDLNDGTWHHVALVHDGAAKRMTIFVDGVQDATSTYTTLGSTVTTSDLFFGRRGAIGQNWFGGQIDEVRIWNIVRNQADIQANMEKTLTGDEEGLVAYWPLDQGARGVAPDVTGGGANGLLHGGAYWIDESAFPLTATTDANGNYTFSGVRYGNQGTLSVTPIHPTRSFNPASKQITLSAQSPVQNEVAFIDDSDFTLAGRVVYEYAGSSTTDICPAPDVQFFVQDGNADPRIKGTSESDGTFAVAVAPSDPSKTGDTRTLTLKKGESSAAHTFVPSSFSYRAEGDSSALLFKDQRIQKLSGFIGGGGPSCPQSIGTVTLTVTTEDGCFNQAFTFSAPGPYKIALPPQRYLVDVAVSNIPTGLDASDVTDFFETLGTQEVDLTTADASLDLIYRAPMAISIAGLPTPQTSCSGGLSVLDTDGATVLRTLPNVPVVAENEALNLTIAVNEDYGNGNLCPVTAGTLTVFDGIGDKDEAVELAITDGVTTYETTGRSPDVFSGRIVDGVDRSFQKSISVTAEVEGRDPATHTEWAFVEGFRERTGTFVSATTDEIPLLVVHDPPGSNSYAYLDKGTTFCSSISNMEIFGGGAGAFADLALGFKSSNGLGVAIESGAGLLIEGRTLGGGEQSRLKTERCYPVPGGEPGAPSVEVACKDTEPNLEICMTTTEKFATSANPSAIQDDVYAGVALNLLFAKADDLREAACQVTRTETLAADLNPDDAFETAYVYSNSFISGVMIPELEGLKALAGGDQALNGTLGDEATSLTLADAIANWNKHLANNQTNIGNGLKNAENRSFSGGLVYENSVTVDSTQAIKHDVDISWGRTENDIGAVITGAGYDQKAGLTFEVYGQFMTEKKQDETASQTVGWVFDDGDGQDFFSVDVGSDPVYGTPVFGLKSGRTSNPCEPGTQCRDNPTIMASPPEQFNIPPDSTAFFTLTIGNDSESGERREYVLAAPGEHNPGGAVIKANGNVLGGTNLQRYLIEPGQAVSVELSVERGAANTSVFSYEDLALVVYPEDEYEIWRADMRAPFSRSDTAFVSVNFASACTSVRLADLPQSWTYHSGDPALQMRIADYRLDGLHVDGDLSQLTLGAEVRRAGSSEWLPIAQRNGRDLQAEAAASFTASWTPQQDGTYEVRAFSQCGAPSHRVATVATVGTVDTHAPAVFAPEPADGSLGIGDEARVVFDEDLACASVQQAEINRLAADGAVLETLPNAHVSCDGRTVTVTPEGGWAQAHDGERYQIRLPADGHSGPADELGNTLASDVSWQFVVQRAAFAFNPVRLGAVTARGSERTLEVTLANGKDAPIDFTLGGALTLEHVDDNGVPTGASVTLDPSVQSGSIAAGSSYPVQFQLPPTLAVGTWRGSLTASGAQEDASLGTVPFFTEVEVDCAAPNWHIGPAAFAYQMSVIAEVAFDGTASTDKRDQVAAFVGGELRGLAAPSADGQVYLTVFGNLPEGETVTFKAWQASTCTLSEIQESTAFAADAFVELGRLRPGALARQSVALSQGWTWFSLNRAAATTTLTQALSGLALETGDQIKSLAEGTSTYDAKEGWTGPLEKLELGRGYQIRLSHGGVIEVPGAPAEATTPIALNEGVNWIGYLPEVPMELNTALAELHPTAGDQIKSQRAFAHFVEGAGWIGSLSEMAPGQGYVLHLARAATLRYPAATPQPAARLLAGNGQTQGQADLQQAGAPDETLQVHGKRFGDGEAVQTAASAEATAAWRLDERAYRYTMTLTGTLDLDHPEGMQVGAFIDGELRGSAPVVYVEALQGYRFFLMIHSDAPTAEQVTFQLLDEATDATRATDYRVAFAADAVQGTPEEPVVLTAEREAADVPETFAMDQNYPNPFNPTTTIHYALPEAAKVELVVYDVLGRAVLTLVEADQQAGRYEVVFDASRLASGLYLYRITAGSYKAVKQMILVK